MKKEDNKLEIEKEGSEEKKVQKDLIKVLIFAVSVAVVFFLGYYLTNHYIEISKTFEYEGITFTKREIGSVLFNHYGYYYEDNGKINYYNLYLRLDPRENKVKTEGNWDFVYDPLVTISTDSLNLNSCEDSVIAVAGLAAFFVGNGFRVEAGNYNEQDAIEKGQKWISCEQNPEEKIIEIISGEETKIIYSDMCIKLVVNNCEILNTTEKLIVDTIVASRNRN